MHLNAERKCVTEVDSHDLDLFLQHYYHKTYEYCPAEEENNGSNRTFHVDKRKLSDYDLKKIEELKSGKFQHFITSDLLTDLCNRDIIPAGEYMISCY